LVVNVSITDPVVILGVYVEFSDVAFESVPLGADHVALVAEPPILPFNVTDPPEQTL
jgi:hypothetical protein